MFAWNRKQRRGSIAGRAKAPNGRSPRQLRSIFATRLSLLAPRSSSRRGVLLLVVLSVLVLFLMIGTAFIIVAKQSEKAAKMANAATIKENDAAARGSLLLEVMLQVVRDTDNPLSVLRTHSLLADLYGNDGFRGRITDVRWAAPLGAAAGTNPTGGQMVMFDLDLTADMNSALNGNQFVVDYYNQLVALSPLDDAYAGQVLTFTSGGQAASARGVSTRVVGYTYNAANNTYTFTVMAFPLANGSTLDDPNNNQDGPALLAGSRILVNGRPFNGTGAGFDPTHPVDYEGPRLDAKEMLNNELLEVALLPNPLFYDPAKIQLADTSINIPYFADLLAGTDYAGRGGSDESYDTADFQNMLLAIVQDEPEDAQNPDSGSLEDLVLPSLHRPELINFWAQRLVTAGTPSLATNASLLRKVLLRPNHLDHPLFDGSNAQYANALLNYQNGQPDAVTAAQAMLGAYIFGPWDVDNDNDGARDSIWVDVGLPVMMGPNGKLVKPLAAILVVDLDGRINVNTAGTLDLAREENEPTDYPAPEPNDLPLSDGEETDDVPKGVGWGVAEISVKAALGEISMKQLLLGRAIGGGVTGAPRVLPGKYGVDQFPGRGGVYDAMSQITQSDFPQYGNQATRTSFAAPPDLRARYPQAVNEFGQLVLQGTDPRERNAPRDSGRLAADSPYEASLLAEGSDSDNGHPGVAVGAFQALDAPFSLAELERILRAYDTDATALPHRLASLSGVFSPTGDTDPNSPQQRNRITTESSSVPAPMVSLPHELTPLMAPATEIDPRTNLPARRLPRSTAELFEMRIRASLAANPPGSLTANDFPLFPMPITNPQALDEVRARMRLLLAPELAAGLRLNINRPLGNGRDDNGNGVVDEPGEDLVSTQTRMWWRSQVEASLTTTEPLDLNYTNALFTPLDVNGDGVLDDAVDSKYQRQLMARHLYVLALTLTAPANWGVGAPSPEDQALARRLAQWAINAVDYRDVDNIMSPFEYDLNPFDGWNVDGDLRTTADNAGPDGQVGNFDDTYVWGAERPEVLITETLSWHDRQTEDTTGIPGGVTGEDPYPSSDDPGYTDPDSDDFDPDYDQIVRPRGALFVELYNPWSAEPGASADTHRINLGGGAAADLGVDLTKVDATTQNSPVWRMVIYKRGDLPIAETTAWDPDSRRGDPFWWRPGLRPVPGRPGVSELPVDRSIYFTPWDPEKANNRWDQDGVAFYVDPARYDSNVKTVRPGRYLVVGSGEVYNNAGVYENPIGDRMIVGNQNDVSRRPIPRRRIELNTNSALNNVRMVDEDGQAVNDPIANYRVQAPAESNANVNGMPARLPGDNNSNCVADVAIIDQVWDFADGDTRTVKTSQRTERKRRLTLSEPAHGYVTQFGNARWSDTKHCYINPESNQPLAIDIPLDGPIAAGGMTSEQVLDSRVDDNGDPVFNETYPIPYYLLNIDEALCKVGPIVTNNNNDNNNTVDPRLSYGFIYLQRLANPLLPWNPPPAPGNNPTANGHEPALEVNPYMTVDCMSSDLTVFNGNQRNTGSDNPKSPPGYEEDKETSDDGFGTDTNEAAPNFASLQRGYSGRAGNVRRPPDDDNVKPTRIWDIQRPTSTTSVAAAQNGGQALAPLNDYQRLRATRQVFKTVPFSTLGFLNAPFQDLDDPQKRQVPGAIQMSPHEDRPLTWYPWNNRPYISGNELMLVPRVANLQLMRQYTTDDNVDDENMYDDAVLDIRPATGRPGGQNQPDPGEDPTPFTHLENFFYDEERGGGDQSSQPSHLYRLLEYVETPSLYPGVGKWLNPGWYGSQQGQIPPMTPGDPRINRMPPFNWVSEFREPGRINLNTIFTPSVYAGLFHSEEDDAEDVDAEGDETVHPGPEWDDFIQSRRGFGDEDDLLELDARYPTFFVNPYRSSDAATLVPLPQMVQREDNEVRGVECTLLRSGESDADEVDEEKLFAAETEENYYEADRNPFFRYAPMTRLNNLVTTQSNVYAVWITIGFFEVEDLSSLDPKVRQQIAQNIDPGAGDITAPGVVNNPLFKALYPDGYTLGKEDGLDEGTVKRLRGFYIIDRSRPAGFEPGVDNNVENTIRLRRRIE